MPSSRQVVQYNSFDSNNLEDTTLPCVFKDFTITSEEIFEIGSEGNQVIDNSDGEIERLQQENFDLKKNEKLLECYKGIAEEYDQEVRELSKKNQILEKKIKDLEAQLQRKTRELTKNGQEIEQLKQEIEKVLLDVKNKNDIIGNLDSKLEDMKSEIQMIDKKNEELQQRLNLVESNSSGLRKESVVLVDSIEDLKSNYENQILEKDKELNDVIGQLYVYLSEREELFAEFSSLQNENESLKQKNFYISNEVSLEDELNKENVRKEIVRPQSTTKVEMRRINDNDDQESIWLYREAEDYQTGEDKKPKNTNYDIGVWNEDDDESSDDQKSTWLYEKVENNQDYRTSEDKNLENTDYDIEVWNKDDDESSNDQESTSESDYNVSYCFDYDEIVGRTYGQLVYNANIIRKKDSFSLAKVKLREREREKYESIWQKIDNIHDELDALGNYGNEEDYEECNKRLDKIVSEALKQRVMFTLPYKANISLVDRIIDTLQKLYFSYDTTRIYGFLDEKKILQIVSRGASLNRFSDEEHGDFVNIICSDRYALDQREKILLELKDLVYKSIVDVSVKTDDHDFELEMDNGHFCIKYPKDSVVEVARIFNNKKAKNLGLEIGMLQVGESIVRVENEEGVRNYTDISEGRIEMSFTTYFGKVSVYLSPSDRDNNKIEVKLANEESIARFSKLEDKSSLGGSCLLGGKNVSIGIEDGYFEINSDVSEELAKTMKQSDCTIEKSYVPSSFMKEAYCNQLVNERGI
ncbi:hypothetical protein [Wolbachia endosymbiont (group A) of Alloplasta piceator]|uniref:hypothetical protein n=1 Tax=Wolbachia endosymbiont (group A) of Alloplasta piceator TaxID=3066188 RepID=UPI003340A83F